MVETVFQTAAAILTSLGGGAVIVVGCSNWLGRVWASRMMRDRIEKHENDLEDVRSRYLADLETHKVRLKKSEIFFERELRAASELAAFHYGLLPDSRFQHMDFHDACADMGFDFDKHERYLNGFISKFGAVIPSGIINELQECTYIAGEGKFETSEDEVQLTERGRDLSEDFWHKTKKASNDFIEYVRNQTDA